MEVLVGWSFRHFENSRNVEVPPGTRTERFCLGLLVFVSASCGPPMSFAMIRRQGTRYWLKHKSEMKGLLKMLERVVDASAKLE
jgi:hypothetical protein